MSSGRLLDGRLKIRHLILTRTIAEAGSVVGAAELLHVTQPVVTRGLREVEEILGVTLFERLPRGVQPTVYGEAFLAHAGAVLAQLRAAEDQIERLRSGDLGTITVGAHFAGSKLLPLAIAGLKKEHPNVVVTVKEAIPEALERQLLTGELDVIVGRLPRRTSDRIRRVKLHEEPFRIAARLGHPIHDHPDPQLADTARFPWILPPEQTRLRTELERVFAEQRVDLPADVVECTSIVTLRDLLHASDMITAVPMFVVEQDPDLRSLAIELSNIRRSVGVMVDAERPLAPVAAILIRHLSDEAARMTADADANRPFAETEGSLPAATAEPGQPSTTGL
ncbi:LysR substrate-binding domain-containing protein [Nocardioides albus]|uniref:DNA-binding transcriptional LysR family regulator n=1 Tax=Nocardioides albus TaxID=1841 RepID=A0A7W5A1U4_9ACTN|nr:LysR substrate-binding domain-containing protein [Nocardioides albus]MBB3087890.1 DNA-binding transcriptional LysR family regulator [Nocardioides albus]GGU21067.1 galactose-binding protein [Nocardioides albus]